MKPKEKAIELANKFISKSVFDMTDEELKEQRKQGKAFAIICVDELIEYTLCTGDLCVYIGSKEYWREVKQEISLL